MVDEADEVVEVVQAVGGGVEAGEDSSLVTRSRSSSTAASRSSLVGRWCALPTRETPHWAAIWTMLAPRYRAWLNASNAACTISARLRSPFGYIRAGAELYDGARTA